MPDALICMGRWYRRDKWLYERGLRRASSVLVQSERQQELMRRNFGLDSSIAGLIVQPGSSEREFGERDIDALWVSNMRSVKRPDVLLGVADQLPHVSFHMVGGTVPAGNGSSKRSKRRRPSRGNVTFHGAVPYRDISALLQPRARLREHVRHRRISEHVSAGVVQRHAGRGVLRSGRRHRARGTRRDRAHRAGDVRGRAALDER